METVEDKLHDLQAHKDRLWFRRLVAERKLQQRAQHPSVMRYTKASEVAQNHNLTREWETFSAWFESQTHSSSAPESAQFFLYSPEARILGLRFDLFQDREAVRLFVEAREAARNVRIEEADVEARLQALKQTH